MSATEPMVLTKLYEVSETKIHQTSVKRSDRSLGLLAQLDAVQPWETYFLSLGLSVLA